MPTNTPEYDIVIIGSSVAGALCASRLAGTGARILVLEAGHNALSVVQREEYRRVWDVSAKKVWNTPYLGQHGESFYPSPGDKDTSTSAAAEERPYYDQAKANPRQDNIFKGVYQRMLGGTAWTWRGNVPRLIPNDFRLNSVYGLEGVPDWPISYDDLESWYCDAEYEMGVSGNDEEWNGLLGGSRSRPFPMPGIEKSYSDRLAIEALGKTSIELEGQHYYPRLITTPQARNSRPYDGRPACEGNNNCIPLCPTGAKYDASTHLKRALLQGVRIRTGCVAWKLEADSQTGRITKIIFRDWMKDPAKDEELTARFVILATNPIESPKILLESGLATKSGQVGRNLMDHLQGEVVAEFPEPVYPFRGPQSITGIEVFRDGPFRSKHAAFRMTLGNDGWGRAGNPTSVLEELLNEVKPEKFHVGKDLRDKLIHKTTRLVRFGFSTEQLPDKGNLVKLSDKKDKLGIRRPEIVFSVTQPYTKMAFEAANRVARELFKEMGARVEDEESKVEVNGQFKWNTANHPMGTCRMGGNASDSVVDSFGRCHEHQNLFIIGSSVFPTGATANSTLTIAALTLRTAQAVRTALTEV